jgi:hypothetical protein
MGVAWDGLLEAGRECPTESNFGPQNSRIPATSEEDDCRVVEPNIDEI